MVHQIIIGVFGMFKPIKMWELQGGLNPLKVLNQKPWETLRFSCLRSARRMLKWAAFPGLDF